MHLQILFSAKITFRLCCRKSETTLVKNLPEKELLLCFWITCKSWKVMGFRG